MDNGGTYDQSLWLAGKLLQTGFCNNVTKRNKYLKVLMTATYFIFETIYKTLYCKWRKFVIEIERPNMLITSLYTDFLYHLAIIYESLNYVFVVWAISKVNVDLRYIVFFPFDYD